jgi:hypothetical protein
LAKEEDLDRQRIGSALAAMSSERKTSVLVGAIRIPSEAPALHGTLASVGELR